MEAFPPKLLGILDALDSESACTVVVNNISGLTARERQSLRCSLVDRSASVLEPLQEFLHTKDASALLSKLKSVCGPQSLPLQSAACSGKEKKIEDKRTEPAAGERENVQTFRGLDTVGCDTLDALEGPGSFMTLQQDPATGTLQQMLNGTSEFRTELREAATWSKKQFEPFWNAQETQDKSKAKHNAFMELLQESRKFLCGQSTNRPRARSQIRCGSGVDERKNHDKEVDLANESFSAKKPAAAEDAKYQTPKRRKRQRGAGTPCVSFAFHPEAIVRTEPKNDSRQDTVHGEEEDFMSVVPRQIPAKVPEDDELFLTQRTGDEPRGRQILSEQISPAKTEECFKGATHGSSFDQGKYLFLQCPGTEPKAESPVFSTRAEDDNARVPQTVPKDEVMETEPCDNAVEEEQDSVLPTDRTERLFEEYTSATAVKREERIVKNPFLGLGVGSLLRYISSEKLLSTLEDMYKSAPAHCGIHKAEIAVALEKLALSPFYPAGETVPLVASTFVSLLDMLTPGAELQFEDLLGLTVFCKDDIADRVRSVFKHLATKGCTGERASLGGLRSYLGSLLCILAASIPNPAKQSDISTHELAEQTAAQCFEDCEVQPEGLIETAKFVEWFSAQARCLAPAVHTVLRPSVLELETSQGKPAEGFSTPMRGRSLLEELEEMTRKGTCKTECGGKRTGRNEFDPLASFSRTDSTRENTQRQQQQYARHLESAI